MKIADLRPEHVGQRVLLSASDNEWYVCGTLDELRYTVFNVREFLEGNEEPEATQYNMVYIEVSSWANEFLLEDDSVGVEVL